METLREILQRARDRALEKQLPYTGALTPREAYAVLQQTPKARLIDVRSKAELELVGKIPEATHIEWAFYPGWTVNPDFAAHLQMQLDHEALAMFICRTGGRSHHAATLANQHGFSEASLKSAWRNQTNQEIAASIIGYIRQAAIGEALLPFDQRVAKAMQTIYAMQPWTPVQRKWLDRLAKQLVHEVIIDPQQVNDAFRNDGGLKALDRNLGGNLDQVLEALNNNLWQAVS